MRPLRILTWHVHGSYLYYLSKLPHELYLPIRPGRPEGYGGRSAGFPWRSNVRDVPADQVRDLQLDAVIYQSKRNWEIDGPEILSDAQRRLPAIYIEHDPPRESPTDTHHHVDDPDVLLVHVTPFNALMWDSGRTPTRVIDHGVTVPEGVEATYELARGITVVNNIARRGRRLGPDVFERARREVPIDLVGLNSADMGGLGDLPLASLPAFEARYRFFFNPIRYTSMGLAVCEAMLLGLPVVGLATTEMSTAIENGVSGFVDTNPAVLIDRMHDLLRDPALARRLGEGARRRARERFGIGRFVRDWNRALADVTGYSTSADRVGIPIDTEPANVARPARPAPEAAEDASERNPRTDGSQPRRLGPPNDHVGIPIDFEPESVARPARSDREADEDASERTRNVRERAPGVGDNELTRPARDNEPTGVRP